MLGSLWFGSFSAGGGGAAADYELISTTVLGSSAASVTFSGLNTGFYKHLQIRGVVRSAYVSGSDAAVSLQFNGDTATNYNSHYLYGSGGTPSSGSYGNAGNMSLTSTTAGASPSGAFGPFIADILDPFSTSKNKTVRCLSGSPGVVVFLKSGLWMSTAAVTSITLYGVLGNMEAGSRFSIYGLRG